VTFAARMPWWAWVWPVLACPLVAAAIVTHADILLIPLAVTLIATVFAAVYHAELVAHKIGEPFGTLVLAIAVTVIEVALVVSVMIGGGEDAAALARDTVFAAVMIACNGIVGLCLLVGGVRHHQQGFQVQGASAAMAVLAALTTLSLILPNFTTSTPGPFFNASQLIFAGVMSLVLYCVFVFVQTVRHRGDFLQDEVEGYADEHPAPPGRAAVVSSVLLVIALVAVVGLAKALAPTVEATVARFGAPKSVVGVVIAALVLLPEGLAAVRAAQADRLQTSLNLALGSALASIGLTIPVVAVVSIAFGLPLSLGLGSKEEILLALTIVVGVITLGTGRTTVLQGAVHLVILAAFLFLAVIP
jgi:Ca2+:H+ antiporter